LIASGAMTRYKDTRNGMLGADDSTRLSAWLALGCLTARQVHARLTDFERGDAMPASLRHGTTPTTPLGRGAPGYGAGEGKGTAAVRFELLWRDYMRLCARKYGARLFALDGFHGGGGGGRGGSGSGGGEAWLEYLHSAAAPAATTANAAAATDAAAAAAAAASGSASAASVDGSGGQGGRNQQQQRKQQQQKQRQLVQRFLAGRTGTGLVDASQRELFLTGYTSNRARQNVASFLAQRLRVDWRVGAEWYDCLLVDADVCSNWGNWQYVSGVGNDPRSSSSSSSSAASPRPPQQRQSGGRAAVAAPATMAAAAATARVFNPVKQAFDYDARGDYVRAWLPELRALREPAHIFQAWTVPRAQRAALGLPARADWLDEPLVRIEYSRGGGKGSKGGSGGGSGRGGREGGDGGNSGGRIQHQGQGQGKGRGKGRGRSRGWGGNGAGADGGGRTVIDGGAGGRRQ
jgi:deoxyribodipyrimidine photo-lyase